MFYSKNITKRDGNLLCRPFFILLLITLLTPSAWAEKVYQKPNSFVKEQFGGKPPKAKLRKLTPAIQEKILKMNGREYNGTRLRYWKKGTKSVYVLNDIGKTLPITIGYVLENGKITKTKVLVYRESHGNEVTRKFFTKQLTGANLKKNGKLSKKPRNIAGATLSVRTMTRMAKVALYLDSLK